MIMVVRNDRIVNIAGVDEGPSPNSVDVLTADTNGFEDAPFHLVVNC
jgi:hypothetical protein